MSEYILDCGGVTKRFGGVTALSGVTMRLAPGRIVGLLGPNGSGKTTLIKIINKLLVPDEGAVYINGLQPGTETKKMISYLPDREFLSGSMSVEEVIGLFSDFFADFRADTARAMTDNLGINPKAKLKTLSKGNREKVRLIMAMSRRAKLYLLDEPIGGVDPAARDYIINSIITNYSTDATVLISTHLIADVEKILDEVIFIREGSILLHESADAMREREGRSVDTVFREVFRC